ncbi:hypothetical protein H4R35_006316 [Dimargaris xerosporica]|nr:hypothetical protein H4R35_006316 [Dimargaris xerosporica]
MTRSPIPTAEGVVAPAEVTEASALLPTAIRDRVRSVTATNAQVRRHEVTGLGLMTASALGFSLMSLFVKLSGERFPTMEIVFSRSILHFCLALAWCWSLGKSALGPRHHRGWLLLRGASGTLGLACFFYGLTHLPLADATVLFFTSPVFTAIFAHYALNETFTRLDKAASALCMVGIVLVAKPSFLFGIGHIYDDLLLGRLVASVMTVMGAILGAISYVIVRKVGTEVHFTTHIVYFGGLSALFAGSSMVLGAGFVWPTTWQQWGALVLVGICSFLGQACLSKGLQMCRAGPATLMRNLDVVFAFAFGIFLFGEIPDLLSITGAVLVLGCTVGMGLNKWLR